MRDLTASVLQTKLWTRALAFLSLVFLTSLTATAKEQQLEEEQAAEQTPYQKISDEIVPTEQGADSAEERTTPQETLKRLLINNGSSLLLAGLTFPTVHKLPSTMSNFCSNDFLLKCDIGMRISHEKRNRPISGASAVALTRITLDGTDQMTTLLYSKGLGVGLDLEQVLGVGAEIAVGLGVTHLRVNNDKAFTPTADVDVSVGFNISRLVYRFGGYYRDMLDARVDGIKYGTTVKALYFSVGISL